MLRPGLFLLLSFALSAQGTSPIQYRFSLTEGAQITTATVDPDGNVYFAGSTTVALPATPGAFRTTFAACPVPPTAGPPGPPCSWGFVGKVSPNGRLLWLTYMPEPNGSSAVGTIAIDGRSNVYFAGTYETINNLPPALPVTAGALQATSDKTFGVFIAELNSSGSALVYSTFFNKVNVVEKLYPDSNGNLYLGMRTEALVDLPLVSPLSGMAPSIESAYLAKLNATGSGLLFATWVNAPGARSGIDGLTLDALGNVYVVGTCFYQVPVATPCVPTTSGALQNSTIGTSMIYAMKLRPDGTLVFCTLLGGSGSQQAAGISVDAGGNITIAGGLNDDPDYPVTPGAFQTTAVKLNRQSKASGFVSRLNATGSTLLYSTYFGGSSYDGITGFALDSNGNSIFSGYSYSPDLPMTSDSWQPCHPVPQFEYGNGAQSSFIGALSADGRSLKFASFLDDDLPAPNGIDVPFLALAGVDSSGDLYLFGAESAFSLLVRYRIASRPIGSAACVANATHGSESALSPLGLVRIRGNALAGSRTLSPTLTAAGTLPLISDGLQVFIGDTAAPLFEIGADEITVVVPELVPTEGTIPIRVAQNGIVSAELDATLRPSSPAIVTTDGSGFGSALALNQDGSVNSHVNPAAPGSIVSVYAIGLGATSPLNPEGTVVTAPGHLQEVVQGTFAVQVSLYGTPAEVPYAGPAPGLLAGFYQVNFRVPVTAIVDWAPLKIVAGVSAQDQAGIYVSCAAGATCVLYP